MCATCGCGVDHDHDHPDDHHHDHHHHHHHSDHAETRTLRLERDLLARNDAIAADNRALATARELAIFNFIGSPGAGKTALLEAVIRRLEGTLSSSVLEGDQATDRDKRRIEAAGGRAHQINTGRGCHLDAKMVAAGIRSLDPSRKSCVFVENVGNLVCPALFDIGEHAKIVVMSVTEGEDKPLKYPHVFRAADLFVLTKIDLAAVTPFDETSCRTWAHDVNPRIRILPVSARSGAGVDDVCSWLLRRSHAAFRTQPREVHP